MSSLPFETSNVFLSILTLVTLYNSLVSITPPNPNPYAGQSTKSAPAEKNPRPNDTVAFTAAPNLPSQAVMCRLGMRHAPGRDFEHPSIPEGSPLRPHVLWTVTRAEWDARG